MLLLVEIQGCFAKDVDKRGLRVGIDVGFYSLCYIDSVL